MISRPFGHDLGIGESYRFFGGFNKSSSNLTLPSVIPGINVPLRSYEGSMDGPCTDQSGKPSGPSIINISEDSSFERHFVGKEN